MLGHVSKIDKKKIPFNERLKFWDFYLRTFMLFKTLFFFYLLYMDIINCHESDLLNFNEINSFWLEILF